jgi:hypothetical protein
MTDGRITAGDFKILGQGNKIKTLLVIFDEIILLVK